MNCRRKFLAFVFAGLVLIGQVCPQAIASGTAFTYQGRLNDNGGPASGNYDLNFALFNVSNGVGQVSGTLTNSATVVSNGLFTVLLDFGTQFAGADRWLEISVRTNGSTNFTTLVPRQPLTPVPYAIYAANASNVSGTISARQISGTVSLGQLPPGVVTNGATGINLGGSFNGSTANAMTNLLAYTPGVNFPLISTLTVTGCISYPFLNGINAWVRNSTNGIYTKGNTNFLFYDSRYIGGWCFANRSVLTNATTGVFEYDDNLSGTIFYNDAGNQYWTPDGGLSYDTTVIMSSSTSAARTNIIIMPSGEVNLRFGQYVQDKTILSVSNSLNEPVFELGEAGSTSVQFGFMSFYGNSYGRYDTNDIGQVGFEVGKINSRAISSYRSDTRIEVDLPLFFNSDASGGSQHEKMMTMPQNWGTPNNPKGGWSRGFVQHYAGLFLGDTPVADHTYNRFPPAWVSVIASTNDRPQLLLEGHGAFTGTVTNGGMWSSGTNIFAMQYGKSFPIPQLNQSNATVTAAFTFTWTFVYPFSDTNYSVSVSGGGTTLSNPAIGAKTTTNVVVTFSSFTGILNLMAVRQ